MKSTLLTNQARFRAMRAHRGRLGPLVDPDRRGRLGRARHPGRRDLPAIATPMYDAALEGMTPEQLEAHRWTNEESIALGKQCGDPDRDLRPVMVFLASDASGFITGQPIPVDAAQISVR